MKIHTAQSALKTFDPLLSEAQELVCKLEYQKLLLEQEQQSCEQKIIKILLSLNPNKIDWEQLTTYSHEAGRTTSLKASYNAFREAEVVTHHFPEIDFFASAHYQTRNEQIEAAKLLKQQSETTLSDYKWRLELLETKLSDIFSYNQTAPIPLTPETLHEYCSNHFLREFYLLATKPASKLLKSYSGNFKKDYKNYFRYKVLIEKEHQRIEELSFALTFLEHSNHTKLQQHSSFLHQSNELDFLKEIGELLCNSVSLHEVLETLDLSNPSLLLKLYLKREFQKFMLNKMNLSINALASLELKMISLEKNINQLKKAAPNRQFNYDPHDMASFLRKAQAEIDCWETKFDSLLSKLRDFSPLSGLRTYPLLNKSIRYLGDHDPQIAETLSIIGFHRYPTSSDILSHENFLNFMLAIDQLTEELHFSCFFSDPTEAKSVYRS